MFHFLIHLTPSMYEDQYDNMKIAYSARKLLFLHTLKIYPTPDHVTRVRERILSDSVVLLSICSYLLVLILSKNFSPIMSSAIKKLNLLNRSSFEIVFLLPKLYLQNNSMLRDITENAQFIIKIQYTLQPH